MLIKKTDEEDDTPEIIAAKYSKQEEN
jgi:hypothetical protein